jgi:glycosyltransferase involved in cell wall biosynthesis
MLGHQLRRSPADVIHACGIRAAATARMTGDAPLIVRLYDPVFSRSDIRLLRSISQPRRFALSCSARFIQRRLIERGVPPDVTVVIRPGVDFAAINRWRRGALRESLGIRPDDRVIILPAPVTAAGGHFEAFHAASLHSYLNGNHRIIVPGDSREARRIVRYGLSLPGDVGLIAPPPDTPFEQLLAISDVMIMAPRGDCSTTSIAWAMGARVAVVGTAVPAVIEMIAHKVNGLLVNPRRDGSLVKPLAAALADRPTLDKARETAHGQAYESFGVRRFVEQTCRLYDNVISGAAVDKGITDSASKPISARN